MGAGEVMLRYLHLLALVVWIGGVIFFSLVAAPTLFQSLPREVAGRATSVIFPRYYLVGAIAAGVALVTALATGILSGRWPRALVVEVVLIALMGGMTLYAGQVILPEAQRIRAALPAMEGSAEHPAAQARWAVLHRRSVRLNGAVLVLGLATLWIVARRP
jgi:uncharacterized membrane protein